MAGTARSTLSQSDAISLLHALVSFLLFPQTRHPRDVPFCIEILLEQRPWMPWIDVFVARMLRNIVLKGLERIFTADKHKAFLSGHLPYLGRLDKIASENLPSNGV